RAPGNFDLPSRKHPLKPPALHVSEMAHQPEQAGAGWHPGPPQGRLVESRNLPEQRFALEVQEPLEHGLLRAVNRSLGARVGVHDSTAVEDELGLGKESLASPASSSTVARGSPDPAREL